MKQKEKVENIFKTLKDSTGEEKVTEVNIHEEELMYLRDLALELNTKLFQARLEISQISIEIKRFREIEWQHKELCK